jgi:hypothetical protein
VNRACLPPGPCASCICASVPRQRLVPCPLNSFTVCRAWSLKLQASGTSNPPPTSIGARSRPAGLRRPADQAMMAESVEAGQHARCVRPLGLEGLYAQRTVDRLARQNLPMRPRPAILLPTCALYPPHSTLHPLPSHPYLQVKPGAIGDCRQLLHKLAPKSRSPMHSLGRLWMSG